MRTDRPLPNLLIAGVPKAGTSSLFRYLSQHPEICPSDVKEIRYFNPLRREDGILPSVHAYSQHFIHHAGERYTMEATPSYCYGGARLLEAIHRTLEHPQVIIILREPVARLWSAYTFQRTRGHLPGINSFEQYVSLCVEKRRGQKRGRYFGGVTISSYGEYIPRWFDVFGNSVKVTFSDDLFRDARAVVVDLCRWLGIDTRPVGSFDFGAKNKTAHARNLTLSRTARALNHKSDRFLRRAPVVERTLRNLYLRVNTADLDERLDPDTRRRLEDMFRESNRRVASTLVSRGYQGLPSWLDPGRTESREADAPS